MFEDYTKKVKEYYEKKKADQELSVNLMFPSPANLKNECLIQFKSLTNKSDIRMMKSFFGKSHEEELLASKIRVFDRDKFRPLQNFLLNEMKTQEKNVELLALLINFEPRPYSQFYKYGLNKNQNNSTPISEELTASSKSQNSTSENQEKQSLGSQVYGNFSKTIILEYPSGVKLSVDTSDLGLIASLVRL